MTSDNNGIATARLDDPTKIHLIWSILFNATPFGGALPVLLTMRWSGRTLKINNLPTWQKVKFVRENAVLCG